MSGTHLQYDGYRGTSQSFDKRAKPFIQQNASFSLFLLNRIIFF